MKRILAAEAIGTLILVATVVGSGIMAQRLSGGNDAVALLGNTAATAAVLYVLITLFAPISGAQFNPVVTLLLGSRAPRGAVVLTQVVAAIAGTVLAHAMFGRNTPGEWIGEGIASFGLLMTITLALRVRAEAIPALVAAWIVAGYWFTSSTSFANPAVTIARMFTDSFSGIRPVDAPAFIIAQLIGASAGWAFSFWIVKEHKA
jgi:glycerol uptake facilitator-like aquaporin